MIMPAICLSEEQHYITSNESGGAVVRMDKDWRDKLWIEFKRDAHVRDLFKSPDHHHADLDDDWFHELKQDVEELRLDKKTATEEFLVQLFKSVQSGATSL